MTRLPRPDLERDGDGVLRSRSFDDIYFSPEDGLAESRYVFVDGNDLPQRMASRARTVVGELGFGTGLNVLALLAEHEASGGGPLDIWTCEGFPLDREGFRETQARVAERWPEVAPHAARLAEIYPDPVPGLVQLQLDVGVTLTIWFGPVLDGLRATDFRADAWFLDGFAPSRNPEMWSAEVMEEVARLTRQGGTAATFSVAGGVRSALEGAGFVWEKSPGFGRKRHMLRAVLGKARNSSPARPWFASPEVPARGEIAVIGAGIAGGAIAHALAQRERRCTVFGVSRRDEAASANPAGLIMPRLDADDTPAARFYRDAFFAALRTYDALDTEVFSHCGGELKLDRGKAARIEGIGLWPEGFLETVDDWQRVAAAGVLDPRRASEALIGGQTTDEAAVVELFAGEDGWRLRTTDGRGHGPFSTVVLATGAAQDLWPSAPVTPSLGQIDVFDGPEPGRVRTDGGYVAPLGTRLVAGATYEPYDHGKVTATDQNTEANRRTASELLGEEPGGHVMARAALRATTLDRHPVAGPLYDEAAATSAYQGLATGKRGDYPLAPYQPGLYALTGLGSRGLVTAPILAAHVAALITGGVSPLTRDIAELVHPGRFLIRDIKRGKVGA